MSIAYKTVRAELTVAGKDYVLVHAGLESISPERPLDSYAPQDMLFCRADYAKCYFPDRYLITGHTPTRVIRWASPGRIYRANNQHRHGLRLQLWRGTGRTPAGGRKGALFLTVAARKSERPVDMPQGARFLLQYL